MLDQLTRTSYELRRDIIEMIYKSKAGHVGGDMSVIDALTVLFFKEMNVGPDKVHDPERDRFVLSKAHCADALYCVLGRKGYFDEQEAIDTFSQFGSNYIGHPNMDVPGIEINGGSLGHGLSVSVGMALAGKMKKHSYRVYTILGDGEMAEGSNYEAMMSAGHYHLDNLCAMVDLNRLQISGTTKQVMDSSDLAAKFHDFGWNVIEVSDGNNCQQLIEALELAKGFKGKPTVLILHTVKGKGISFMENQVSWHHGKLTEEQYQQAVKDIEEVLAL